MLTIVILVAASAATTMLFWRLDRPAGLMLLPCLAFVAFAALLNGSIVILNWSCPAQQPSMDRSDDRHRPVHREPADRLLGLEDVVDAGQDGLGGVALGLVPHLERAEAALDLAPLDAEDGPGRKGDRRTAGERDGDKAPVGDEHDGVARPALRRMRRQHEIDAHQAAGYGKERQGDGQDGGIAIAQRSPGGGDRQPGDGRAEGDQQGAGRRGRPGGAAGLARIGAVTKTIGSAGARILTTARRAGMLNPTKPDMTLRSVLLANPLVEQPCKSYKTRRSSDTPLYG